MQKKTSTPCLTIDPHGTRTPRDLGARRLTATASVSTRVANSVPVAEEVEEPEHDAEHPQRAEPADCGGVATVLVADLEGRVPHVDRPRVGRPVSIEAAGKDV